MDRSHARPRTPCLATPRLATPHLAPLCLAPLCLAPLCLAPLCLALCALTLAACGDGPPPGGDDDAGTSMTEGIGPEGGTVTSDDGRLTLYIPPGALSEPTNIQMITYTGQNLAGFDLVEVTHTYGLLPDGLEFNEGVLAVLRADPSDVPPMGADGYTRVYGLVSHSNEHGLEVVGFGIEEETADGSIEYAGVIEHFSDLALGRVLQSKLELDCQSDCALGPVFDGSFHVRSQFDWNTTAPQLTGGLRPRMGSRGITGMGPLLISNPITIGVAPRQERNEVVWDFGYACTAGGAGTITGHFLGWQTELSHPNLPVRVAVMSRVGAWGEASVMCADAPPTPMFETVSVTPSTACPGATVEVYARGFASNDAAMNASVVLVSEDESRTLNATVHNVSAFDAGLGVEAGYTITVPRGVELGTPGSWSVIVELEDATRSEAALFVGQVADCPIQATSFVGNWRTITDTMPDDGDCTGVNGAAAWRFWPDGTWGPIAPRIQDSMNGESVRRVGGSWTGSWNGSAYEITANLCPSPSGRTETVTARWYPETNVLEAYVEGINRSGIPYTANYCGGPGHTVTLAGCHVGACQASVEPFAAEATCYHTMSGLCYDETMLTCYDNDGVPR